MNSPDIYIGDEKEKRIKRQSAKIKSEWKFSTGANIHLSIGIHPNQIRLVVLSIV